MKTQFISTLFALLVSALCLTAQTDHLHKIQLAQNLAVDRIVNTLSDTNLPVNLTARAVKDLAEGVVFLQASEEKAYRLADARDAAPQTMTKTAMERSLAEAAAMGVSRNLRNNLRREWEHAGSLQAADMTVLKTQDATTMQAAAVSQRGGFRRMLPGWAGGTTSYANHRVPPMDGGDALLAERVKSLEKKLGIMGSLGAPSVVK